MYEPSEEIKQTEESQTTSYLEPLYHSSCFEDISHEEDLFQILGQSIASGSDEILPDFSTEYRVSISTTTDGTNAKHFSNGWLAVWERRVSFTGFCRSLYIFDTRSDLLIDKFHKCARFDKHSWVINDVEFLTEKKILVIGSGLAESIRSDGLDFYIFQDGKFSYLSSNFSYDIYPVDTIATFGGQYIIAGSDEKFMIMNGHETISQFNTPANCFAIQENQKFIALGNYYDPNVHLYADEDNGNLVFLKKWKAQKKQINAITFLNHTQLASGGGSGNKPLQHPE